MAQRMAAVFPALKDVPVDYVWGGFVDISMNRAPDFGRLGSNVYYLQGFSGHGVALTGLAGQLVAEAVAGQTRQRRTATTAPLWPRAGDQGTRARYKIASDLLALGASRARPRLCSRYSCT
jgi:glycine/D-amino acid oxidase-like deaminating enzyme